MKLVSFDLTYRALGRTELPRYKANLLRSAFGTNVAKVGCGMANHRRHQPLCLFERLNEGQYQNPSPRFPRVAPFVIECHDERTVLSAGDTLATRFILASAPEFHPVVVDVWRSMGKGLAGNDFALVNVTAWHPLDPNRTAIVADSQSILVSSITNLTASEEDFENAVLPTTEDMLEFATPCRIESQKQAIRQPRFADIIRGAAHRALALGCAFGKGEPAWASREVINAADSLQSTGKFSWWEWERLSSRHQETEVYMDGFVGAMLVRGNLKLFHPLLSLATVAHIGKGVTSGNGLVKIR